MLSENFIYLAAAINSLAGLNYLIDTLRGRVQPNKVTWLLWALAPLIAFTAEMGQGVGLVSVITFLAGFFPLLIFLASFLNRKSRWKLTTFDFICGGLSVVGLLLWYITRLGNIAITFSILADLLAGIPTLIKSFNTPQSESARAFFLTSLGSVLTVLTISSWTFANYAFPGYLVLMNGAIFVFIYFKVGKLFRK